jgi:hypothetical protein
MCFDISPYSDAVQIAEKDIVCYKRLLPRYDFRNNLKFIQSPYQDEIYFKRGGSSKYINKKVKEFTFNKNHSSIFQGLHTYIDLKYAKNRTDRHEELHKAIIPKGTKYYYNNYRGEYVSLKLRVYRKAINIL